MPLNLRAQPYLTSLSRESMKPWRWFLHCNIYYPISLLKGFCNYFLPGWFTVNKLIGTLSCNDFRLCFICLFQGGDENSVLPYWLSNASALLCLLQRNLRSNSFLNANAQRSGRATYVSSIDIPTWDPRVVCMFHFYGFEITIEIQ